MEIMIKTILGKIITQCAGTQNCVNLAWSIESGVWNSIPSLGFTIKNDINKHVWYSISSLVINPMLVLNPKFGIGSEFPKQISVLFNLGSQAWYLITMLEIMEF